MALGLGRGWGGGYAENHIANEPAHVATPAPADTHTANGSVTAPAPATAHPNTGVANAPAHTTTTPGAIGNASIPATRP
jgi:hypothetical protein